ncbi:MAG: hypothetical protein LQ347_006815 [Umbilicaria vellea]|nr:MAG: hypothetical protein LQ347_006815 [Umbilicaria vellea]
MRAPLASGAAIALCYHLVQVTAHSAKALRGTDNVYKHHGYVDHQVRRNVDAIINHGLYHGRNIVPFPTSLATSSPALTASTPHANSATASAEPQGWDNQAQAACKTALSAYINQTNPSGMAACYNIPYFNNATGAFEADLRLYRVAHPSGDWTGFTEQGVSVGLSYPGASVAASRMPMKWNKAAVDWPPSPRDGMEKRGEAPPLMLQVLDLVGMVNGDLMGENIDE